MNIKRELGIMREKLRRRKGHKPGQQDATGLVDEAVFYDTGSAHQVVQTVFFARPNFYYFQGCGRPCYLPLNPGLHIGDKAWAVTEGWPCEFRSEHDRSSGPHCYCEGPRHPGDWLRVIGQMRGQIIQNDIGQQSDVWDVILLPGRYATRNTHRLQQSSIVGAETYYYAFAPDMWLGNTGWRNMPFKPWWKLPTPPVPPRG